MKNFVCKQKTLALTIFVSIFRFRRDKRRSPQRVGPSAGFWNRPLCEKGGLLVCAFTAIRRNTTCVFDRSPEFSLIEMERLDAHCIHALEEKRGSEGTPADLVPKVGFGFLHAVLRQSRDQIGIAHPLAKHFRPQNPFRIRRPICHKRNPYDSNIIKYDAI